MTVKLACSAVLLLALSGPVAAQTAPAAERRDGAPAPQAEEAPAVDVSRLPVNVARLQRQLQRSAIRDESVGLNLRYIVDVFGQAPPIVFLPPGSNIEFGPVPYGAPTHAELLRHITPQEYRAPAANFTDVFRWLADKARR
jgi:hypothetical protein